MAMHVEDQIHAVFIAKEEARCLALGAKKGKQVKRRQVLKPWTRTGPLSLLQDPEFLQYVTQFDYRLDDPVYEGYCRKRGVFHVVPEEDSWRYPFLANPSMDRADFLKQCARGAEPAYASEKAIETGWRIVRLGRAALQDSWEVFLAERAATGARLTTAGPREEPVAAPQPQAPTPERPKRPTSPRKSTAKAKTPARRPKATTRASPSKSRKQLGLFDGGGMHRKRSR